MPARFPALRQASPHVIVAGYGRAKASEVLEAIAKLDDTKN